MSLPQNNLDLKDGAAGLYLYDQLIGPIFEGIGQAFREGKARRALNERIAKGLADRTMFYNNDGSLMEKIPLKGGYKMCLVKGAPAKPA